MSEKADLRSRPTIEKQFDPEVRVESVNIAGRVSELQQLLAEQGPFDIVLAFSQAAAASWGLLAGPACAPSLPGPPLAAPVGVFAAGARMSSGFIDDVTKLWRVRKTVFKMLADRGYYVIPSNLEETKEEFAENFKQVQEDGGGRERFIILVHKAQHRDQQMIVFFPEENKRVGVKPIRVLAEKMDERGIKEAILVVRQPLTPLARTAIQEAMAKMRIEVFAENELIVNITDHELVPQHVVLSEQEKQQLLSRYKLKPTQLPRVQITDPVARYFGMQRDQVVKIIRASETAGRYVTYRICV